MQQIDYGPREIENKYGRIDATPAKTIEINEMQKMGRFTPINMSRVYRSLETLPEEAWRYIDDTLNRIQNEPLVGQNDLNTIEGLSFELDGMGQSVYTRKRIGDIGDAVENTNPSVASDGARAVMDNISVPMYVTYKDFNLNTHEMAEAARVGLPLPLALVEEATRSVLRKVEYRIFNGSFTANGATAYSYLEYTDTKSYTLSGSWTTATPSEIVNDVNAMMQKSIDNKFYGPWMLYIPRQYQIRLNEDYLTETSSYPVSGPIRRRILELPDLMGIRPTTYLPNDKVVLLNLVSNCVQMINAMPIRAVAWEPPGSPDWDHKFKVMTMQIPFCQSDKNQNCGIIKGTL